MTITNNTVELTLDTAAGVTQFLEYVQDVVFTATSYEADALAAAMEDPTHASGIDALSIELHDLYSVMRTEIAAAASRGGMNIEEATKLQLQYNELVSLRDQMRVVVNSSTPAPTPPTQKSTTRHSTSLRTVTNPRRKTLTLHNQNTNGSIPISVSDEAKRSVAPKRPIIKKPDTKIPKPKQQKSSQSHGERPTTKPPSSHNDPKTQKKTPANLPSPGISKPTTPQSIDQLPLLPLVRDQALVDRIKKHPQPKQLAYKIKAVVDSIESVQTDKFAAWLGDGHANTFAFIQDLPLHRVYELAALSITDLRAELAPSRIRPEAFLHWVQVVTDIQATYPATTDSTTGEIVISALVLQELAS